MNISQKLIKHWANSVNPLNKITESITTPNIVKFKFLSGAGGETKSEIENNITNAFYEDFDDITDVTFTFTGQRDWSAGGNPYIIAEGPYDQMKKVAGILLQTNLMNDKPKDVPDEMFQKIIDAGDIDILDPDETENLPELP